MNILKKIKETFWGKDDAPVFRGRYLFNYRRIWRIVVILTGGVSLIPLVIITFVDYQVTQRAIESEFLLRTTRIVSNTRRTISFFLTERKSAIDFIIHDNSLEILNDKERLSLILINLQKSFGGGFVDLGLIDSAGFQRTYVGPYRLEGKDYSGQEWYRKVVKHGVDISDVFLGYRNVPHIIIAVKNDEPDGSFYILRASFSIAPFEDLLSNLELSGMGDAFLINHEGMLQTSTKYFGNILEKLYLPVPQYSSTSRVLEMKDQQGKELVVGYGFIDESPFILMIVKNKYELMNPWYRTRVKLIVFLILSITVILTVILKTAGYMIKKIKIVDEKRVMTFHQVEYSNKMASIGRIAASVAHEINNPLAIINEKAGLIKDLFMIKKEYETDDKLIVLVDSILNSVQRTGRITKRLLTFARNLQASIEPIDLKTAIQEVLGFVSKEAELRGIDVVLQVDEDIPVFESDRGKLQQIFLNIINNALAAVEDGGHLEIRAKKDDKRNVNVTFSDDGCGIGKEDLNRIFEPFFSTKTGQGGTGLGLSITYNLIQEIGGNIDVSSELNKGTTFNITIPLNKEKTG
ncbi:MAG: two-component sensor histidine kinase [Deltaproteobacteria bacterium]|nr:two-component sensor histidine kinase [Deltaproteobacteria bacterium]